MNAEKQTVCHNDKAIYDLIQQGRFKVDASKGFIYSTKSSTPDRPLGSKNEFGYLQTTIRHYGNRFEFKVHRMIWIAVYGIPPEGKEVSHENLIKTDNSISNLKLVTPVEKMRSANRKNTVDKIEQPFIAPKVYVQAALF